MACDVQFNDIDNESFDKLTREAESLKSRLNEERAKLNDKDGLFTLLHFVFNRDIRNLSQAALIIVLDSFIASLRAGV